MTRQRIESAGRYFPSLSSLRDQSPTTFLIEDLSSFYSSLTSQVSHSALLIIYCWEHHPLYEWSPKTQVRQVIYFTIINNQATSRCLFQHHTHWHFILNYTTPHNIHVLINLKILYHFCPFSVFIVNNVCSLFLLENSFISLFISLSYLPCQSSNLIYSNNLLSCKFYFNKLEYCCKNSKCQ